MHQQHKPHICNKKRIFKICKIDLKNPYHIDLAIDVDKLSIF
jgi:hypothetical protein